MSEVFEKIVAELNLDRCDWQLVKFGDIAIQQKQKVDRENTNLTRYVKGEHMYSEDMHLQEWGELQDEYLGPAFIRKFEEGDILYGSRRTYLRKVVIAPFEGITSNTTFVVKANEEKLDKRLLPFIMLSEGFSQHSIKNSKGSVNPYVNWKDLSNYEFLLPPLNQQAELVALLLSSAHQLSSLKSLRTKYTAYKTSSLNELFFDEVTNITDSDWLDLDSYCQKITYGFTNPMPTEQQGVYMVTATNIRDGKIDYKNTRRTSHSAYNELITEKSRPLPGDVLLTKDGRLGELAVAGNETMCINQSVALLRPKECLSSEYLYYLLKLPHFQNLMLREAGGTALKHIYITKVAKLKVPLPEREIQDSITKVASSIFEKQYQIDKAVESTFNLQKSIINQVF